jgi:uncharacterized membrane protein (DUF106 family)
MITQGQLLEGIIGSIGVAFIFMYKHKTNHTSVIKLGVIVTIFWLVIWIIRKSVVDYYNHYENKDITKI